MPLSAAYLIVLLEQKVVERDARTGDKKSVAVAMSVAFHMCHLLARLLAEMLDVPLIQALLDIRPSL